MTTHTYCVLKRIRGLDIFVVRVNKGYDPPTHWNNVVKYRVIGEFKSFDDARKFAQKERAKLTPKPMKERDCAKL